MFYVSYIHCRTMYLIPMQWVWKNDINRTKNL